MDFKTTLYKLRSFVGFFGMYILFALICIPICSAIIYLIFIGPRDPDLGIMIPMVFAPIVGMTMALVVVYFFERGYEEWMS